MNKNEPKKSPAVDLFAWLHSLLLKETQIFTLRDLPENYDFSHALLLPEPVAGFLSSRLPGTAHKSKAGGVKPIICASISPSPENIAYML